MFPNNSTSETLDCRHIAQCGGCQIASMRKSSQIDFKKSHFSDLWRKSFGTIPEIEFIRPVETAFRDRVDLTIQRDNLSNSSNEFQIEDQRVGFYKKDSRDILDINSCPLMSKNLEQFYNQIRKINFPVSKGSLRIRVSPTSSEYTNIKNSNYLVGVWLDFANEDIKKLLEEKSTLEKLLKISDVIEIGQKRKRLAIIDGQFKLIDSETHSWFETYDKNLTPVPLHMNVGSFSQTGFKTNKELISQLIQVLKSCSSAIDSNKAPTDFSSNSTNDILNSDLELVSNRWLELCSGSGNLTFPLLSIVPNVIATELDENAVESLKATANRLNLSKSLQVEKINIHKPSPRMTDLLSKVNGILADPPRSGLQGFLEVISQVPNESLPDNFVYVSCFAETLISDLKIITDLGYKVEKIMGIDQFPHSTHCEWIVHLKK